ncbi:MAG: AMP-binding protein, partial [Saezia sp.]
PDDVALLQYTGGTTGVSKGAVLLHQNLLSNLMQTYDWVSPAVKKLVAEENQLVFIAALPFYHIFAFMINFLVCFHLGGAALLVVDPRDTSGMLRSMKKQPFHVFAGVSTLFNTILHHPQAKSLNWSSLRLSVAGGMSVPQATAQGWHQLTGCPMVEGYGMSETSPVICATCVEQGLEKDVQRRSGIGHPIPSTEVILLNEEDQPVGINTPGELCVRGPQVMAGYWNNPEETAKIMTKDGFLRTGDIAVMDDEGWLKIVDRKKDLILVSGFNVYPNEVEDVVALMDGVKECVAVGLPNEKSGEAVAIIVVKRSPDITAEQVKAWCKQHLTGYKCPRYVLFRDELPKSAVGKILRKELKPILEELMQKTGA